MSGDDKYYIRFAVAQRTFLRYPFDFVGRNGTWVDTTFIVCTGVSQLFELSLSNYTY